MNLRAITYRILGYKTTEELMNEMERGLRSNINEKEINNSRKLENALISKNTIFPKGSELYEAIENFEISYLTHHFAPYTGGGNVTLKKGERIIISEPNNAKPIGVYAMATNYTEIEKRIINEELQESTYSGYSLSINTKELNKNFKKIELKPIEYLKGDATIPKSEKTKILVHICNDVGGWGKGFVLAISKKWKEPETAYRKWYKEKKSDNTDKVKFVQLESKDKYSNPNEFKLGNVQFVKINDGLWIANMIAQRDIKTSKDGIKPIRYVYVSECLQRVQVFANEINASVHMPRIGCGLAGGEWNEIEKIVNQNLIAFEIETKVYDFE